VKRFKSVWQAQRCLSTDSRIGNFFGMLTAQYRAAKARALEAWADISEAAVAD
jgi:hypothetical protein